MFSWYDVFQALGEFGIVGPSQELVATLVFEGCPRLAREYLQFRAKYGIGD